MTQDGMTPARVAADSAGRTGTGDATAWESTTSGAHQPGAAPRIVPFRFLGSGAEYFKIWVVNVALTIVTLGIYSAWAKVRTKNYFYRNTYLDDASFEYTANPLKILKGRIIVGALFIAVSVSQQFSLAVYGVLLAVFFLLLPAMLALSASFNARYSSYRHVAFHFGGRFPGAYKAMGLGALIYVATLGMGFPVAQWMVTKYFLSNYRYGKTRFDWTARIGQFYGVFFRAILFMLPALVLFGATTAITAAKTKGGAPDPIAVAGIFAGLVLFYVSALAAAGYVQAQLANVIFGSTHIGPHKLRSHQRAWPVIGIMLSNALAVACTLGLLYPWAKVRLMRYRLEHLEFLQHGDLVVQADPDADRPNPFGDAVTDFGDLDFDFGF